MTPLVSRDDLTRLPTRAAFDTDLRRRLSDGAGCALLLCDLDYLKLINDTFGHLAGDEALRALAQTLHGQRRPGWEVYRLGGDEFAVLAGGPEAALAEWGQARLRELAQRPGRPLRVSMGVAAWEPGLNREALFARADARLLAAKRLGRGQVVVRDPVSAPGAGSGPSRLLERDEARARTVAFWKEALARPGARLTVQAPPGGGLSAFLCEADRIAQHLGYQTLHVRGDPGRAARPHGAWEGATLSGVPLAGPPDPADVGGGAGRPLALLLDAPEFLGACALAELAPLLAGAQAVLTGQAAAPGGPAPDSGPEVLSLPPLTDRAVLALAEAQVGPLGEGRGAAWLCGQVRGLPARLAPRLSALRLEAELRGQSVEALTGSGLRDWEDAAARQVPSPPPPPHPYLHGRGPEVREAARRLGGHALLTLTGPAGRGKTRLARQLLAELGAQAPGGAHEVPLRGVRVPELALARISEVLLGTAVAPVTAGTVARLLGRRPTLLLLDDAAPAALPAPLLEALLARSPGTRLIVTSRAPLGVRGEAVLALAPLPDVSLRAALAAQAEAPDGEDEGALDALTRYAAGEPDTLTALLPLVQTLGLRGAAEHLERSGRARQVGAGPWPELGSPERRVLAALSTFGGPFDLAWAQEVSGSSSFLLSALIHRHLLRPVGGGLYRLPEQLLDRGQAHLRRHPATLGRARQRGLRRAQAVLRAYPPQSAAWFAHLDLHAPTLRALLAGHLHAPTPPDPALLRTLLDLMPYRLARAHLYDAREDLHAALRARPGEEADAPGAARRTELQLALASTLQRLGDHAQASALAGEARARAETLGDPVLLGSALLTEARILHRRSVYPEARALFGRARSVLEGAGRPDLLARALGGLARSGVYLGELEEAQAQVEEALRGAAPLDRPRLRAELLNTAGLIATERRDLGAAQARMEEALALHEAYGGREGQTLNLTGLAWVALLRGDFALSAAHSGRVLQQARDSGQGWEIANALVNLGHALARQDQLAEARARFHEAALQAAQCDAPSVVAEALGGLADVLARERRPGEARALLTLALAHPGANAEVQSFFAPLHRTLVEHPAAPLPAEIGALLARLRDPPPG
ncbi:diguanylate cyclase (GGDEF)-like protein [Deinococcus sp. HSC-46F16]|uniref:diguanylate cyclase domain-containing protein n=1 Tax=Deinococcus sp. HSC-46F16 TaxID=2910968 RepID=UPI00273A6D1C|nr:diguanylate cyclase [Deinococcus sp. HSC-46F16]MCP2014505.1 diguanylate cyclase (GGDEF)-like protein [Deinococcus sp. HSC-46F16]